MFPTGMGQVVRRIISFGKRLVVFARAAHNDAIHEHSRHPYSARCDRLIQQSLDLREDLPSAIVNSLRNCQHLPHHGLLVHYQIAKWIRSRGANDSDVHRKSLVKQPHLPEEFDALNEFLGRDIVESAASLRRIDERAKPDVRDTARPPGGNVS